MVLALTVLGESASHIVGIIAVILLVTTIGVCFAWLIYITVEHIRTKGFCRPLSEDEEV